MPRPLGQRAGKPRQATETHVCQGGTDCTTAGRWIRCNNNAYRRVRRRSGPGEEVSVGGGGSDGCWRPQRRTAPKACHGRKETSHGGLARDLAGGAFPGRRRERRLEHPCAHRRAGQIGADLASAASINPCAPACGRSRRARRGRVALGDLRNGGAWVRAPRGQDATCHTIVPAAQEQQRAQAWTARLTIGWSWSCHAIANPSSRDPSPLAPLRRHDCCPPPPRAPHDSGTRQRPMPALRSRARRGL